MSPTLCACVGLCARVRAWKFVLADILKSEEGHVKPCPLHHTRCQRRFSLSILPQLTCPEKLIGSDILSRSMKDVWFPLRVFAAEEIPSNLGSTHFYHTILIVWSAVFSPLCSLQSSLFEILFKKEISSLWASSKVFLVKGLSVCMLKVVGLLECETIPKCIFLSFQQEFSQCCAVFSSIQLL